MTETVVVKLGTSSLYNESTLETRLANISQIVETVCKLLKTDNARVCLVSSGGIAAGLQRMGLKERPSKNVARVQAMAAIGQCRLMNNWDRLFDQLDQPVAQILVTRTDLADHQQYHNASAALKELLDMGVVPIVNENDTLTSHEARFGDNDTLSAIVAAMVDASHLFLLTDVECLYTANPHVDPENAKPIRLVKDVHKLQLSTPTDPTTGVGTGGMTTKLIAAELATSAGIPMYICSSALRIPQIIAAERSQELDNSVLYTKFEARKEKMRSRKFWLLHSLSAHGKIDVDTGAFEALTRPNRAGLLPVGIAGVEGSFHASECVDVCYKGSIVGRCLVNYSSVELARIKGQKSKDIRGILGYADSEYVAHRDNLAFY